MPGPLGSPRVALAASYLIEQPGLSIEEAMRRAKYPAKACLSRRKQKNVSQKKRRIVKAAAATNTEGPQTITLQSGSNASSSVTVLLTDSNTSSSTSNKENSSKKSNLQKVPTQRDKTISSDTRRTPHQVLKAQQERNKLAELRKDAHQWALEQLVHPANTVSAEAIARQASEKFKIQVLGNTIQKMR